MQYLRASLVLGTALSAACAAGTADGDSRKTLTASGELVAKNPADARNAPQNPADARNSSAFLTTSASHPAKSAALTPIAAADPVTPAAPAPQQGAAQAKSSGPVARPAYNTGKGFFVSGKTLYDANGYPFRIRGMNHTHFWGGNGEDAIVPMAKAGANAVRAVFGPNGGAGTPAERERIVQQYVAQGVVPVVDYHNATCSEDPSGVSAAVDFWTGPDGAWVKSNERYLLLNITNEWGPDSDTWRDAYVSAVARLRQAGIKSTLVIDAGGACGQLADSVETFGQAVLDADPEKNVVFSIHMYSFWKNPGDKEAGGWGDRKPYDLETELARLDATGLPIIVGEFSWQGFHDVPYDTRTALETYEKHGVGWLAWMWFNPGGDGSVNMATSETAIGSDGLTEFGKLVVDDPGFGLRAKAAKATVF